MGSKINTFHNMENNDMLIELEQLKTTLEKISSARQQVTETVSAYGQTQSEIESYIQNLIGIENGLNDIITLLQRNKIVINNQSQEAVANLKKSCDSIITETSDSLTHVSDKFSNTTKEKTDEISVQIDRFESAINRANGISSNIERMSNEVSKILGLISSLKDELATTQHQQDIVLNQISDCLKSLSEDMTQQKGLIQSIQSDIKKGNTDILAQLSQSEQSINSAIATMNNNLEGATVSIQKSIKAVQYIGWAILVGVVMSIILHFM